MIKTEEQIQKIRKAGKILAGVSKEIKKIIKEGVSLKDLNALAENLIIESGAKPEFLGYKPHGAAKAFPASICTSLNDVVVHGIPNNYKLKNSDLLKLDFGVNFEGGIADGAFSVGVGDVSFEVKKLIDATYKALLAGIKECVPGKTVGDIGWAINNCVKRCGFKVVKGLTGHGVGVELHEEPTIFNEGQKNTGIKLETGMVLAIEPMVSAGSAFTIILPDESFATSDRSLSAHFEHTILITNNKPEILTK